MNEVTPSQSRAIVSTEQEGLDQSSPILSRRWSWLIRLFTWYSRRFIAKNFNSVRIAASENLQKLPKGPLVVALNHPSWWDPLMAILVAGLVDGRKHAAPIDAKALERYRFFERLGFFGLEPGTAASYRKLIAVADEVFAQPDGALWITPQGQFTDTRAHPLGLKQGIGHVITRLEAGAVLPVAFEYTFWFEKQPEALIRVGEPIIVDNGDSIEAGAWTATVEAALLETQDELARASIAREESAFEYLIDGRRRVSAMYDLWRWAKARLRGETFVAGHGDIVRARLQEARAGEDGRVSLNDAKGGAW